MRNLATQLLDYEIHSDQGTETFHAKMVLADGVAAYVGSVQSPLGNVIGSL